MKMRDNKLSDNLLRMLGERDMSQTGFARDSKTSVGLLNRVINGRCVFVRLDTLRKWRAELGCTWDELLE